MSGDGGDLEEDRLCGDSMRIRDILALRCEHWSVGFL